MKRLLTLITTCAVYLAASAQCSVIEIPLAQRALASDLIVEGKVTAQHSFWNADNNMIYTANTIEIYKIFKGTLTASTIELLTVGGIVGDKMITAEPSLELKVGEVGIFTCENLKRFNVPFNKKSSVPQYEAYASVQGFVRYNLAAGTASDVFKTYADIQSDVYSKVLSTSFKNYKTVKEFDRDASLNKVLPSVQATITSFTPANITAGTFSILQIDGTGFGAIQGAGTVGFKNADDGGATYINPDASQYLMWSDTQILVQVPDNAGTGTIRVTPDSGPQATSSGTLTVSYAEMNVLFSGTVYQTKHFDRNGTGGYVWQMNTNFDANANANAAFMRAFDSWRCNTGINWTIGSTTSINNAVNDNTNCICFDNTNPLSAGILGVCFSYWQGCGSPLTWYVEELDIIFDDGSNIAPLTWEFGPSAPSGSEYDFESVAVHELGHGHQLAHVIDNTDVMNFSISNGTSLRTPNASNYTAAGDVQSRSVVSTPCIGGAMTNYTCGTPPVADFSGTPTTLCEGATVSYTDLSTNSPTSWAWTFVGGTPSSSTAQNPTITYNTAGTYAVTLVATNGSGSDTKTVNGYITVNTCGSPPVADFSGTPTTLCAGSTVSFTDLSTNSPTSWAWSFTGGTPSSSTAQNPTITYNTPGTYAVTLVATNGSGSDTKTVNGYITVNSCVPNTQLNPSSCGINLSVLNQTLYCNPVSGANNYQYRINGPNMTNFVYTRGYALTTFRMDWVTGVLYGATYSIEVRARIGTVWGSYSTVCTVTTPPTIPSTQLAPGSCGVSLSSMTQTLYCSTVSAATNYQYRINGPNMANFIYTRGYALTTFRMDWITGVQYGATYSIEVRAKDASNWGTFASVCTVTTPTTIPTTQLAPGSCGATLTTLSQTLYCNSVPAATNYQYRLNGPNLTNYIYTRGYALTTFAMSWIPGVQAGQTYAIEVRANVGGIWGTFGSVCNVTVPIINPNDNMQRLFEDDEIQEIKIFPNPFTDNISVNLATQVKTVVILNSLGEKVYSAQVNAAEAEINAGDLVPGIYFMQIETTEGVITRKIIKQ